MREMGAERGLRVGIEPNEDSWPSTQTDDNVVAEGNSTPQNPTRTNLTNGFDEARQRKSSK